MKKILACLFLMIAAQPFLATVNAQSALYQILTTSLKFPEIIESPDTLLKELLNANDNWNQASTDLSNENNGIVLLFPTTLQVKEFPWLAEAAIADYREALRLDFIAKVGQPDGLMTMSGLLALAGQKRLPGGKNAGEYLATHDRDRDNRLTIEEFTPAAEEIIKTTDIKALTACFTKGLPYPTGQQPIAAAGSFGLAPAEAGLFTNAGEIEQRIESYAASIGGTTYRRPDGRLGAQDANDTPIHPLPEDVVPLHKLDAEARLQKFADDAGYTIDFFPDRPADIRSGSGISIPMQDWPPFTQPPYHPEEGAP